MALHGQRKRIQRFNRRPILQRFNENLKNKDFIINMNLMQIAVCYYKTLYHQIKTFIDEGKHYYDLSTIDKKFKEELMNYSKVNPPYEPIPESEKV